MNALQLAERLAKETKELADLQSKRSDSLAASKNFRYCEWVREHAETIRTQIQDQEFLIEGIKSKLRTMRAT